MHAGATRINLHFPSPTREILAAANNHNTYADNFAPLLHSLPAKFCLLTSPASSEHLHTIATLPAHLDESFPHEASHVRCT